MFRIYSTSAIFTLFSAFCSIPVAHASSCTGEATYFAEFHYDKQDSDITAVYVHTGVRSYSTSEPHRYNWVDVTHAKMEDRGDFFFLKLELAGGYGINANGGRRSLSGLAVQYWVYYAGNTEPSISEVFLPDGSVRDLNRQYRGDFERMDERLTSEEMRFFDAMPMMKTWYIGFLHGYHC